MRPEGKTPYLHVYSKTPSSSEEGEPEERLKGSRMAELTLISPYPHSLQPLVEGALRNELRLLEAGTQRSDQRLQAFEARYGVSTAEFVQRYENDALEETRDFAEWIGEYRLRQRLLGKADILRAIRFAD
jgi:hypothetical protein